MTTAFAHFVRGQWAAAAGSNAGGALLALVVAAMAPWSLASAALGSFVVRPPQDKTLIGGAAVIGGVTIVDWLVRLAVG